MIEFLVPLKPLAKLGKVCTDNIAFRLHYRITLLVLLASVVILSSKQFLGEPIQCMNNGDGGDKDVVNSYCWVYGTYTLSTNVGDKTGYQVAYSGIRPESGDHDPQIKHKYYQWVGFVLLGQAVMFYMPRYLWKIWEEGRMKTLTENLDGPVMPKEWCENRRTQILSYFKETSNYVHNEYAIKFAFCELLNLFNVICQIFLIDSFLDGAFRDYGEALATFSRVQVSTPTDPRFETVGPLDKFFPKFSKCLMNMYGPSGSLMHKDRLCILPLNLVNEKIFALLWFWYIVLTALSTAAVVFRLIVLMFPQVRMLILRSKLKFSANKYIVSDIEKNFGFGGWFFIMMLSKNLNPIIFNDLVYELAYVETNKISESKLYGNLEELKKDLQKA